MELLHEIRKKIEEDSPDLWSGEIVLGRKEYLTLTGQIEPKLYYILQGSLRVFYTDEKGEEHTIRFGYSNSFISSLDSFLNEKPSFLTIQAIKESHLNFITKPDLLNFIINQGLILDWSNALSEIIGQQVIREIDLISNTPVERFNRLLSRSPNVFQEIPHKYIASYLRMSPETLSRLL